MSYGVGRSRGLGSTLLWLWCRLAGAALVQSLALKLPYAAGVVLKEKKNQNNTVQKWADDLNRHFFKEDIQIVKKHMKRSSTSFIIREMHIETKMRYQQTSVRMAIDRKSSKNMLQKIYRKETFSTLLIEM